MEEQYYSHSLWKAKPGNEERFLQMFKEILATMPSASTRVTLIQSLADPTEFYSFARWNSPEDVQGWVQGKGREVAQQLGELCERTSPGGYKMVGER